MATRSMISMVRSDGTVRAVYCHWDGYPAWVGAVLHRHYNTLELLNALLAKGDLSSLDKTLEESKFTDTYKYLNEDGSEDLLDAPAMDFFNDIEAVDYYESMWCEWFYKYEDGIWWARSRDTGWRSLAGVLEDVREESNES